jgi:two-component system sensor histidine kinase RegB
MRRRASEQGRTTNRPGYEGMGLGLFIAKTLLERSGARLTFSNGGVEMSGAIVIVEWPREMIEAMNPQSRLGENAQIMG